MPCADRPHQTRQTDSRSTRGYGRVRVHTDNMSKKMLIDATHAEETRVVVVDGNKVEEFDFESASRRQLAGNIYLAKVTRVEPSLQAAFIDYGGNRHGFLAFSEIHPDYYQIPIADREALLAEERAYAASQRDEEDAEDDGEPKSNQRRSRQRQRPRAASANGDAIATQEAEKGTDISGMEMIDLDDEPEEGEAPAAPAAAMAEVPAPEQQDHDHDHHDHSDDHDPADAPIEDRGNLDVIEKDDTIESVGDADDVEDIRPVRKPRAKRYKIQEVVKVRQIMLVQVVKEERGNKGAALTTYLSLAGRYCVLMPNTARGGGISRKITNAVDRKKLKEIANEIEVPDGAGLIIRTAGSQRTKSEIKRDYEYLQRLWEQIRELTLRSIAPAKIYEEGDLIKRSIRDLYSKDIDEVLVEGEAGYRIAKDFMKMIMPTHAKNVKLHTEQMPLFARFQVEGYLSSMFNPTVQLPSGGYIVIGVTEALVAIDVNSGRATKEGSIEQTALKTNLEASDEIARQLRLRDLAGLIVIDYIDMDERKNNGSVEKRFKDRLKTDRARIQVGRISGFGLLEMSRQRLRPGRLEATTQPCSHCHGTGLLRSDDNVALAILRQLEEEGVRGRSKEVLLKAPVGIMNFLINQKREHIAAIELRYGMAVRIEADLVLISPDFSIEKFKTATRTVPDPAQAAISGNSSMMADEDEDDLVEEIEDEDEDEDVAPVALAAAAPKTAVAAEAADGDGTNPRKKRRRRRRRRGGPGADGGLDGAAGDAASDEDDGEEGDEDDTEATAEVTAAPPPAPRTRTRSRGRGRGQSGGRADAADQTPAVAEAVGVADVMAETVAEPAAEPEAGPVATPKPRTRSRAKKADVASVVEIAALPEAVAIPEAEPAKPASRSRRKPKSEVAEVQVTAEPVVAEPVVVETVAAETVAAEPAAPVNMADPVPDPLTDDAEAKPKRRGWWSLARGE